MLNNAVYIQAYLCLGSNMGDSETTLASAVQMLEQSQGIAVEEASPLYFTEPQGFKEQPWFCNQVLRLACAPTWTAEKFLHFCLKLEEILGRQRPRDMALRFGPRVIDIDLLLFGEEHSADPFCTLPHPRMLERAFVLIPLRHVLRRGTLLSLSALEQCLEKLPYTLEGNKIYQ